MGTQKAVDLDDLLDSALDDLEQQEKEAVAPPQSPKPTIPTSLPSTPSTSNNNARSPSNSNDEEDFTRQFEEEMKNVMGQLPVNDAEEMKKLLNMFQSGDIEKTISEMQRLVMQDKPTTSTNTPSSPALPKTPSSPSPSSSNNNNNNSSTPFTERISTTLQSLAEDAKKIESQLPADMDPSAMEKLMEQFENNKEFQAAMEGMVQQLIAKDTLYDPMKELRERYPVWLKENEKKLAVEDYQRYIKQYECVQKICTSYEKNGEDYQEVIALMQEMADCGQPPQEIIQELAPGVQFGADGMPILPGGEGGSNPACSIM